MHIGNKQAKHTSSCYENKEYENLTPKHSRGGLRELASQKVYRNEQAYYKSHGKFASNTYLTSCYLGIKKLSYVKGKKKLININLCRDVDFNL